jgi:hypothetical protein
LEILQ